MLASPADNGLHSTKKGYSRDVPRVKDICAFVVEHVLQRWYDLFLSLGIKRSVLDRSAKEHRFDSASSVKEITVMWLDRKNPPASWQSIGDALRYKLLETEAADKLQELFYPKLTDQLLEEEPTLEAEASTTDIGEYTMEYTTLLIRICDSLGQDSYGELHYYLCELRCPGGSHLLDPSIFHEKATPDGLLISLLHTNQSSWRDLDLLVHIIKAMNRRDLLPAVQQFVKRVGLGRQSVTMVHDWKKFGLLKVYLNPSLHQVDSGVVSVIKHSLCTWFQLAEVPYNLPFIGWTLNPIVMHFQPPLGIFEFTEQGLKANTHNFVKVGIEKIELEIGGAVFVYGDGLRFE